MAENPTHANARSLYNHARKTAPKLKHHSDKRLSAILRDARRGGASAAVRDGAPSGWLFPDLKGRRAQWGELLAEDLDPDAEWQADPQPTQWDGDTFM